MLDSPESNTLEEGYYTDISVEALTKTVFQNVEFTALQKKVGVPSGTVSGYTSYIFISLNVNADSSNTRNQYNSYASALNVQGGDYVELGECYHDSGDKSAFAKVYLVTTDDPTTPVTIKTPSRMVAIFGVG